MKVFVCDIDGTIYSHQTLTVNPRVVTALNDLLTAGIPVVFASARVLQGVKAIIEQLKMENRGIYAIASNGSEIYQNGYLYQSCFPDESLKRLFQYAMDHQLNFGVDQNDYLMISQHNEAFDEDRLSLPIDLYVPADFMASIAYPVHKVSFTASVNDVTRLFPQVIQDLGQDFAISNGGPNYIDIVMTGHDKAYGLNKLLELLALENQKVYYIGDSYNDLPLMKMADVAACVGNAVEACKAEVQWVFAGCEEGGAADFIRMVLNDEC